MTPARVRIRGPLVLLSALVLLGAIGLARADDNVGVKVPAGFNVSLFADDNLASDIFAMTVDSLGRVAVSGPGYVRVLIDENGDGVADAVRQLVDGPESGAQGLFFVGRDLFCVGDAGMLRYQDENGDDRADGPPEVFLNIKTGGEHHAHALRKGPDGWWYLIAGNEAGVSDDYITLPSSPVRKPQAGAVLRLKPDLTGGEVLADGFRNAYDFDFHSLGDIFVFDSDDERDVSLPWYRPTRVFQVLPGSSAGWISRSWKRPDAFPDMPPVTAEFGRGSPTGVVCYRHRQFPEAYRDAVFVLDWTFGRVMALPLARNGASYTTEPIEFMTGVGQHGFAPTDAAVGRDGSLYVSVGGRGTRGGVYRVTWKDSPQQNVFNAAQLSTLPVKQRLQACLEAPQPLSSWSRDSWMPVARGLERPPFAAAALDENLEGPSRIRAIEIVTELFGGLNASEVQRLAKDASADVRARAIWSWGRTQSHFDPQVVLPYVSDADPLVVRCALEAWAAAADHAQVGSLLPVLAQRLGHEDRFVREAAAHVVALLPPGPIRFLGQFIESSSSTTRITFHLGLVERPTRVDRAALDLGLRVLEGLQSPAIKLQAVRLIQLALGDVGPDKSSAPVFDGYTSRLNLKEEERALDPIRSRLAVLYPTGDDTLNEEISRVLAMLTPYNSGLLDRVLAKITEESHPVSDIHQLIVAARVPVERTRREREQIARSLVGLEEKITTRGLNLDLHWDDRTGELYREVVKHDANLPVAIAQQPQFGRSGHVVYLSELPKEHLSAAIEAFVKRIRENPDYTWTPDVVFVLGESESAEHRDMVRKQFDHFGVRSAVLMVLSEHAEEADRDKFVTGLESPQLEVLKACLDALAKLSLSREAAEQIALLRTLRRLGSNAGEKELREKTSELLNRNNGQQIGISADGAEQPAERLVALWTEWMDREYPEAMAAELGGSEAELAELREVLTEADWDQGDATRGHELFEKRSCAQCHSGRRALGPDLAGVSRRFSRDDLWTAIALPSRDVSPRYQTTMIQTDAGKVYTGLIIYESVDGVILRNATNQTFRIEADEIEVQRSLNSSLMPSGLLKEMTSQDLADLYAYLRSLDQAGAESASSQVAPRQ